MAGGSRMKLRILHTSDFHLNSSGDNACQSLESLVNAAVRSAVDLVIIAGDLFDHSKVDDELVSFAAEQLRRMAIPTVVIAGNHDCLTPGSAFERLDLWKECDNVRILREPDGEILDLPSLGVSLWGKSIDSYDYDVRPLEGIPQPKGDGQWNIAVAHGYYVSSIPPSFPSYNITKEEIIRSGWDYIALGHIPQFRCICDEPVKACYSGSPSLTGAFALVDLSEESGVQVARGLL